MLSFPLVSRQSAWSLFCCWYWVSQFNRENCIDTPLLKVYEFAFSFVLNCLIVNRPISVRPFSCRTFGLFMITWLTDYDSWINDYASGKSSGSASGSLLGHNTTTERELHSILILTPANRCDCQLCCYVKWSVCLACCAWKMAMHSHEVCVYPRCIT